MAEQMTLEKILSPQAPERMRLPDERQSLTHKFVIIGGNKQLKIDENGIVREIVTDVNVYITVGFYADGKLGELFIKIGKEGDAASGVYDSLAIAVSIALQYGIPIDVFIDKFIHTRFEPAGPTKNPDIPIAKSILDYIFKWLMRFSEAVRNGKSPEDAAKDADDNQEVDGGLADGVSGCSEELESEQAEGSGTSTVRVCEEEGAKDKGADEAG